MLVGIITTDSMTCWIIEKSVGFTVVGLLSVGENLFMLPSDIELKIKTGTVGYNNKILVSDGNFSLGKMKRFIFLETPAIKNHKTNSLETSAIVSHSNATQQLTHAPTISHKDEKASLVFFLAGGFTIWTIFQ